METWLNDAPALLYVNNTWLVVNKWSEPLSWSEDANEAAWIVRYVLEKREDLKKQQQQPALKVVRGRKPKPRFVTSESATPSPTPTEQKIAVASPS